MPAVVDKDSCNSCKQCVDICPEQSITCEDGAFAEVKEESCIDCNACVDACPSGAISMK